MGHGGLWAQQASTGKMDSILDDNAQLQQVIGQMAGLARSGRLAEAARLAQETQAQGLVAGPQAAIFHALAGGIEAHRGQFAAATPYLSAAHRLSPQDSTVRANLAEVLYHTGQKAQALALCDLESAARDPALRLARLGGALAQDLGAVDQAIALWQLVVAKAAEDWASWNNLGNALTEAERHGEAVAALQRAAALVPDNAPIRLNLGRAMVEHGQTDAAQAHFAAMVQDFPQDPQPHYSLFALWRAQGDAEAALGALRQAALLAPDDAQIHADLGQYLAELGEFAQAEAPLRAALRAANQPATATGSSGVAQAFVALASLLERLNREEELDSLLAQAEAAPALTADPRPAAFINALRAKRAHDYAAALSALDAAGEELVTASQRLHLRGVLLDRLGQAEAAAQAFAAMNAALAEHPSAPRSRGAAYREAIAQGTALLTPAWRASWLAESPSPCAYQAPIFLLGFPRSGTTLLDTMLMTAPDVAVLEEENIIADIEAELGGYAALPMLTSEQIAAARARYFARAAAVLEQAGGPALSPATRLVDKHPMHLRHAPTIARLFPDARFVLALRHPCDVVLSCWLTNFRLNNAMASFLDLEDAASLYDAGFAQWEQARQVLDLAVGTVVYERLVADPAAELMPLFAWAGLAYPQGGLDHTAAARARGTVTTASYAQVTEPVYQRAAGRWRRYGAVLAPVEAQLAGWIAHWGYDQPAGPPKYPPY